LYAAVDILTHHDGIRHSNLEGQTSSTSKGLLVLISYMLQHLLQNPPPGHIVNMDALTDLDESFSFNEICKRTTRSRFCNALCDTTSDQDTLLNFGGVALHIEQMFLCVTVTLLL
jgi:hypothetical protein